MPTATDKNPPKFYRKLEKDEKFKSDKNPKQKFEFG